jgi:hypothetical protein
MPARAPSFEQVGDDPKGGEIEMTGLVILALIVLLAPLSYLYGVDSRRLDDRGLFGAPRR